MLQYLTIFFILTQKHFILGVFRQGLLPMKKIRTLSFDFDGCLANRLYLDLPKPADGLEPKVITANKELLSAINAEKELYDESTVFIGSNRQSNDLDLGNWGKGGIFTMRGMNSCFNDTSTIAAHLGAKMDGFLLADVYGQVDSSDSFNKAMAIGEGLSHMPLYCIRGDTSVKHNTTLFDTNKISLLYAQMHKVAHENPDAEIHFHFYDDRQDILEQLNTFFNNKDYHPVPRNVILHLHHYRYAPSLEKMSDTMFATIHSEGKGIIDSKYRETILAMGEKTLIAKGHPNGLAAVNSSLKGEFDVAPYALEVLAEKAALRQSQTTHANTLSGKRKLEMPEAIENHDNSPKKNRVTSSDATPNELDVPVEKTALGAAFPQHQASHANRLFSKRRPEMPEVIENHGNDPKNSGSPR